MDVVGPCCGWITGHHGPVIGPDIPIWGVSGNSCASNIGPMCVLSSLKTQQETHMASTSYIYMNGCSGIMLWVDYRSCAAERKKFDLPGWITGHHGLAIDLDIPILGVSGNSCGSNIGLMCALSKS